MPRVRRKSINDISAQEARIWELARQLPQTNQNRARANLASFTAIDYRNRLFNRMNDANYDPNRRYSRSTYANISRGGIRK